MGAVMKYVFNMLPYMILGAPLYLLARWIYRKMSCRKTDINWHHEVGLFLFALFLIGLASQTVIPKLEFDGETIRFLRYGNSIRWNLIPFRILWDSFEEVTHGNTIYLLISLLGNIGIFLPVGFFFSLLWRKNPFWQAVLGGAGVSLVIELCQLPLGRATDVDDLILNTLGALLGYLVYRLLRRLFPRVIDRFAQP